VDRRAFVSTVALSLLAAPLAAEAQPATRVPRIGFLQPGPRPATWVGGFRQGLREHGYVEGGNIEIDYRLAQRQADLPELVTDLVRRNVDVIVTWTTPAALAAKQATAAIPIVAITGNPVELRLVASLARPGANITGIAILTHELEVKNLELLKAFLPSVVRIAVLWNPENPIWASTLDQLRVAASKLDVRLYPIEVREPSGLEHAFGNAARDGAGALLVVRDPVFTARPRMVVDLAMRYRLPAIYGGRDFPDAGGLISYSVNFPEMLRRLATYVDKILKGARPADLPIEQSTHFELVINLKTAKALGLTIPPSLLLRADQVIE
jgi:putative ABC transport system substrate-binding protein